MAKKNATKKTAQPAKTAAPKKGAKTAAPKKGAKTAQPAAAAPKKGAKTAQPAAPAAKTPRETNKGRAIAMLQAGTTQKALMDAFNWAPHTTRGFVSVTGQRYVIESKAVDGVRHYKITGERK